MKYSDLQPTLQNLTNENISIAKIADILGESRQTMHKRVSGAKGDVPADEIKLLEDAFGVSLIENIKIDYYPDVCGSCGNGVFQFSTKKEQLVIPKTAFFTRFSPVKEYFVINAYGNSMEPFICDKDKLIVEHYEGEQIIDNRPYVFCYQDEIFIKRLAKNVNQLVIIPENKDYDVIKLTGSELKDVDIIGQIVGLMRDLR